MNCIVDLCILQHSFSYEAYSLWAAIVLTFFLEFWLCSGCRGGSSFSQCHIPAAVLNINIQRNSDQRSWGYDVIQNQLSYCLPLWQTLCGKTCRVLKHVLLSIEAQSDAKIWIIYWPHILLNLTILCLPQATFVLRSYCCLL